ncbi:MAG: carboxymuconolactone decarboxylase family protein [Acidimicrobiales bacterium]
MSRVQLLDVDTAPLSSKAYFEGGDPGPVVAALAQVPELVAPTAAFIGAALGPGASSARHKEMAILLASSVQGCRYCVQAHTVVSLDAGLSADEVRGLRGELPIAEAFEEASEQALATWIEAMARPGPVTELVWESARAFWPEHILVELAVTIGATLLLNRFATGFELPSAASVVDRLTAEGFD